MSHETAGDRLPLLHRIRRRLPQRARHLLERAASHLTFPADFGATDIALFERVAPYTMTSPERVRALADAVAHLLDSGVRGAFVECGVWRGGSAMAMAYALLDHGTSDRDLVLFDTFEGMPPPGEADRDYRRRNAEALLASSSRRSERSVWCYATEQDVQRNLERTGYPMDRVRLVPGRVEDTLPDLAPQQIALLRLDTDWYSSTAHELRSLYHRVSPGGVIIIDDYGHWEGARRAVDEFWSELSNPPFLHRIDYSGRLAVVPVPG